MIDRDTERERETETERERLGGRKKGGRKQTISPYK